MKKVKFEFDERSMITREEAMRRGLVLVALPAYLTEMSLFQPERDWYCLVPSKSICPATAVVIESMTADSDGDATGQRSAKDSPIERLNMNYPDESTNWPTLDDWQYWTDATNSPK